MQAGPAFWKVWKRRGGGGVHTVPLGRLSSGRCLGGEGSRSSPSSPAPGGAATGGGGGSDGAGWPQSPFDEATLDRSADGAGGGGSDRAAPPPGAAVGSELDPAISSLASSARMAESSALSSRGSGGGAGGRPSFSARLISAARQAAYRCFCCTSACGSPKWRSICRQEGGSAAEENVL